jgi:aryl-alcohol dehydrogenase-like predicted oxidoreductase
MIKRTLGSSDLTITVVGYGAFGIGGWMWGDQDDVDSAAAIRAALESGVNWIDTAPIYGSGRADAVVGKVLKDIPVSQRPYVFTKFGHHLVDGQRISDGSRARVLADCEYGLKTLGVECIDLFQLHWPTPTPIAETAAACAELLKAGKIRAVGVSNFSVEQLEAWRATGLPLHCVQNPYSLFKPEAEKTVLPWCAEHNVGFLAYSPLHRGMLFGTWTADKTFPAGDHRGERPDFTGKRLARFLAAVDEIKAIAEEDDQTCAGLAIGALLCAEGLTGCIVGARNAAQGSALGDLGRPAKAKQLEQLDDICARLSKDLEIIGNS